MFTVPEWSLSYSGPFIFPLNRVGGAMKQQSTTSLQRPSFPTSNHLCEQINTFFGLLPKEKSLSAKVFNSCVLTGKTIALLSGLPLKTYPPNIKGLLTIIVPLESLNKALLFSGGVAFPLNSPWPSYQWVEFNKSTRGFFPYLENIGKYNVFRQLDCWFWGFQVDGN